jgi:hypothetical protein
MLMLLAAVASCKLTKDFISGFETGVFLRDDEHAFRDYNCKRPKANNKFSQQIQGLITPMKLMGNMMKD